MVIHAFALTHVHSSHNARLPIHVSIRSIFTQLVHAIHRGVLYITFNSLYTHCTLHNTSYTVEDVLHTTSHTLHMPHAASQSVYCNLHKYIKNVCMTTTPVGSQTLTLASPSSKHWPFNFLRTFFRWFCLYNSILQLCAVAIQGVLKISENREEKVFCSFFLFLFFFGESKVGLLLGE